MVISRKKRTEKEDKILIEKTCSRFVRLLAKRWSDIPCLNTKAEEDKYSDMAEVFVTRSHEDFLFFRSNAKICEIVLRIQISDAAFGFIRKGSNQAGQRHRRGIVDRRPNETTFDEPQNECFSRKQRVRTPLPSLLMMMKP